MLVNSNRIFGGSSYGATGTDFHRVVVNSFVGVLARGSVRVLVSAFNMVLGATPSRSYLLVLIV